MTPHQTPFLGLEADEAASLETARVVVVPFGYEGGVSYGKGTAAAPDAVLKASHYLELYARKYPNEDKSKDALYNGGLYRATLQQFEDSRRNREQYIRKYSK